MSKEEKISQLKMLINDPELQSFIDDYTDLFLQSERGETILINFFLKMLKSTQLLQRAELVESFTGLDVDQHCVGEDWEWEDMTPAERRMYPEKKKTVIQSLQAQLQQMNNRIEDASIPVLKETVLIAGNETEIRARLLRNRLPEVEYRNGMRFMNSQEVQKFLLQEVPIEHRTKHSAARKIAYDVMKKAHEMFPEILQLHKNKKGLNVIKFFENHN
jgi:hypothetical protein